MRGEVRQVADVAAQRLANQHITRPLRGDAADLVRQLGAVQAQEYSFAKWGLALRLAGKPVCTDLEAACDDGRILRTHVLRPTWHFVAAEDLGWMLGLTGPRVMRVVRAWLRREGLEARLVTRASAVIERSLAAGRQLTRAELGAALARARIHLAPARLAFVAMYAELERIICSGPRRGRHGTYALVSERVTSPRKLEREEALAELTCRFFTSHGPATIRDFAWWSGLTVGDTRRGLEMIGASSFSADGLTYWMAGAAPAARLPAAPDVHLLPIYDEYFVAYRDRIAVPHGPATMDPGRRTVTFSNALVIDGHTAGTWRLERGAEFSSVTVAPLRRLSLAEREGIEAEAARLARFLGASVTVVVS